MQEIYQVQQYILLCDDNTNTNHTYFLYKTVITFADGQDNSGEVVKEYLTTNATAGINHLALAKNLANDLNIRNNNINILILENQIQNN